MRSRVEQQSWWRRLEPSRGAPHAGPPQPIHRPKPLAHLVPTRDAWGRHPSVGVQRCRLACSEVASDVRTLSREIRAPRASTRPRGCPPPAHDVIAACMLLKLCPVSRIATCSLTPARRKKPFRTLRTVIISAAARDARSRSGQRRRASRSRALRERRRRDRRGRPTGRSGVPPAAPRA